MGVARRLYESRPHDEHTILTTTELKKEAAAFRRQTEQGRRLAKSFKDDQDLERLLAYVEELESEAIHLEKLAEDRGAPQR